MEKINVFDVQIPDGRQIRCMSYNKVTYFDLDDICKGDYILFYTIMLYNISKIICNYFLHHTLASKDSSMLKAYKYRLNPTSEQISLMEKTFGSTRFIYNWAL
jgi:hypothetical protein